jgi:TfoX/Sxy family transcriptional regulator of competence genes
MKFPKASPWIKELFAETVKDLDCEPRSMFGYPCAFVHGQMFAGVFGDNMMVRLAEKDRAELLGVAGAQQFDPMGGRPMREYVQFPDSMLEDEDALGAWVKRGFAYAKALPPKDNKKKAKARPAKKSRK